MVKVIVTLCPEQVHIAGCGHTNVQHLSQSRGQLLAPQPLTVIVTTSPCRGGAAVHCALLLALFKSFHHLPGLTSFRIILVCDGYKLTKPGGKIRLKGGVVSPAVADGYRHVIDWLRKQLTTDTSGPLNGKRNGCIRERATLLEQFPHIELMELPEWRGWSSAVEHAMQKVSTPLVMVVQDDRPFTRKLEGLHGLLAAILDTAAVSAHHDEASATSNPAHVGRTDTCHDTIGYVLLPTRKQHDYIVKMRSLAGKRGRKLQPDVLELPLATDSNTTTQTAECGCSGTVVGTGGASEAATVVFKGNHSKGCAHARLVRCWRLLDSTHIASVAWYRSLYDKYPALKRKGMFAEEVLSARHMSDSLSGREWPTWILCTQRSSLDSSPPANSYEGLREPSSTSAGCTSMVEVVAHMDRSSGQCRLPFASAVVVRLHV